MINNINYKPLSLELPIQTKRKIIEDINNSLLITKSIPFEKDSFKH